jgi:hypothetical protein
LRVDGNVKSIGTDTVSRGATVDPLDCGPDGIDAHTDGGQDGIDAHTDGGLFEPTDEEDPDGIVSRIRRLL